MDNQNKIKNNEYKIEYHISTIAFNKLNNLITGMLISIYSLDQESHRCLYLITQSGHLQIYIKEKLIKNIKCSNKSLRSISQCLINAIRYIIIGGDDNHIYIFQISEISQLNPQPIFTQHIQCLLISQLECFEHTLLIGDTEGTLLKYTKWQFESKIKAHTDKISKIIIKNQTVYSASYDKSIKLWELETLQLRQFILAAQNQIQNMIIDNQYIYCLSGNEIRFHEFKENNQSVKFQFVHKFEKQINTILSYSENCLILGDSQGWILLFDIKLRTILFKQKICVGEIMFCNYLSQSQDEIVMISRDKLIKIFELKE